MECHDLTQPSRLTVQLLGITYFIVQTKFNFLFRGPKWLSKVGYVGKFIAVL